MKPIKKKACFNCEYSVEVIFRLECRKHSPQPVKEIKRGTYSDRIFPIVEKHDWCGDHKTRRVNKKEST